MYTKIRLFYYIQKIYIYIFMHIHNKCLYFKMHADFTSTFKF